MTRNSREPNLYTLILHTEAGGESIPWGLSSCPPPAPPPHAPLTPAVVCFEDQWVLRHTHLFQRSRKMDLPFPEPRLGRGKKSGGNRGRRETTKLSAAKR